MRRHEGRVPITCIWVGYAYTEEDAAELLRRHRRDHHAGAEWQDPPPRGWSAHDRGRNSGLVFDDDL